MIFLILGEDAEKAFVKLRYRYVRAKRELKKNSRSGASSASVATYSRQKFSELSWMVKRYYIQDYPENFRGNTETTGIALGFIWSSL